MSRVLAWFRIRRRLLAVRLIGWLAGERSYIVADWIDFDGHVGLTAVGNESTVKGVSCNNVPYGFLFISSLDYEEIVKLRKTRGVGINGFFNISGDSIEILGPDGLREVQKHRQ